MVAWTILMEYACLGWIVAPMVSAADETVGKQFEEDSTG